MSVYHRTPYREGELRYGRLYRIWSGMKVRCYNPNFRFWPRYGGRGIVICDDWFSFVVFRDWALSSGYAEDLSIDRIDPDGIYEPANCRWIARTENAQLANHHKKQMGTGGCTLNMAKASEIKQLLLMGTHTQDKIGAMYGVDGATIGAIKRGVCWADAEPIGPVGQQRKRKRLTADQVLEIKRLLRRGELRYREIGRRFGVTNKSIRLIRDGITWGSVQLQSE